MIMQSDEKYFRILTDRDKKLGQISREINNIITYPFIEEKESNANLLFNFIWIGDMEASHNSNFLLEENIKYIINATTDVSNKYTFIHYINLPIENDNGNYIDLMDQGARII